jgi:hypothetical protein
MACVFLFIISYQQPIDLIINKNVLLKLFF